jgi:PAS domain S-box-containing protein
VVGAIVEHTGIVAYRYRFWPSPGYDYVSESVTDLLGYSPADLYADPELASSIIYPEDRELMSSILDAPDDKILQVELRWIRRDGRLVHTDLRMVLTRDSDGRPSHLDGIVRDITPDVGHRRRLDIPRSPALDSPADESKPTVRVLVGSEYDLTRAGLRSVLLGEPDLELVGETRTARETLVMVRRLQPDMVLLDLQLPDLDPLAATRALKQASPHTSVLVLSPVRDADLLVAALSAGASGFVVKAATECELRAAIRGTLRGDLPVDDWLARQVLQRMARDHTGVVAPQSVPSGLSRRQRQVLELLARGQTNREIAVHLDVTQHTVKMHVEHILIKLNVADRTQAAVRALELGYITPQTAA